MTGNAPRNQNHSIIGNIVALKQNIEQCLKEQPADPHSYSSERSRKSIRTPSARGSRQTPSSSRKLPQTVARSKRQIPTSSQTRSGSSTPRQTKRKKTQTPKYSQLRKRDPYRYGEETRGVVEAADDYTDGRLFRLKMRCFSRWSRKWYRLSLARLAEQVANDSDSECSVSTTAEILEEDPDAVLLRVQRRRKLLETSGAAELSARMGQKSEMAERAASIRRKKEILREGTLPPIFYDSPERPRYPNPIERHLDEYKIPEFVSSSSSSADMPPIFEEADNPALFDADQLIRTIDMLNDMDLEMRVPPVMTQEERQRVIEEESSFSAEELEASVSEASLSVSEIMKEPIAPSSLDKEMKREQAAAAQKPRSREEKLVEKPTETKLVNQEPIQATPAHANERSSHSSAETERSKKVHAPIHLSDDSLISDDEMPVARRPKKEVDNRVDLRKLLMEGSSGSGLEPVTESVEEEASSSSSPQILGVPIVSEEDDSPPTKLQQSSDDEIGRMISEELSKKDAPPSPDYTQFKLLPNSEAKEIFGDLMPSDLPESDHDDPKIEVDSSDFDPVLLEVPPDIADEVEQNMSDSSGEFLQFNFL